MQFYKIVEAETTAALQNKVTGLLDSGWRPVGGVGVHQNMSGPHTVVYFQAMGKG